MPPATVWTPSYWSLNRLPDVMLSLETKGQYPGLNSGPAETADTIQSLIVRVFPAAIVSSDEGNFGFGFGSGCNDLVFAVSPSKEHADLGIENGATLADPHRLVQAYGRVHRRVKRQFVGQVKDTVPRELMEYALLESEKRKDEGA